MCARVSVLRVGAMLAACVAASQWTEAAAPDGPAAAVEAFYAAAAALPHLGVPDADGAARLAPLMTAELAARLDAAMAAEARHQAATDGEEPPLFQGDLFSSLFEGTTGFTVGACAEAGATATCTVDLVYTDASGTTAWSDSAELALEDGSWKLADVVYGGDWPFATTGRLSEVLDAVAAYEQ